MLHCRYKLINKQTVKTVGFDELPPYAIRRFTYSKEQVELDEVPRVIV
jgi:hypothetical protein